MTTLYRPVLIESAEQAEALPVDTVARKPDSFFCQKLGEGEWLDAGHTSTWSNAEMIGWTALVPIEAEEEHGGWGFCTPGCERIPHSHYPRKRLVIPWEAV